MTFKPIVLSLKLKKTKMIFFLALLFPAVTTPSYLKTDDTLTRNKVKAQERKIPIDRLKTLLPHFTQNTLETKNFTTV